MKYLIYLLAIIILLGINLGLFNYLQIQNQMPNLLLLLTLCFALEKKDYDFFFIAFVSGLFLDFYSTGFFGQFTLAFLLAAFFLHIFANILALEQNFKTLSAALAVCVIFFNFFVWLYSFAAFKLNWTGEYLDFKMLLKGLAASLVYSWLLLYPVYLLSQFLKRSLDRLNQRSGGVVR